MPKCMIHRCSWRDDLERGEYFECPECERIREHEERLARERDEDEEEEDEE